MERTIRSVQQQTYDQTEHVLIDGGSTDGTLDIIRNYKDSCRLSSEPDDGIYDAMNRGVALARGDFLLFINAGDYLLDDTVLEKCAGFISVDQKTDVFFGNLFYYNRSTGSGWMWRPQKRTRPPRSRQS